VFELSTQLTGKGKFVISLLKRMFGMAAPLVWSRTSKVLIRKPYKIQLLCSRSIKEIVHPPKIILSYIIY